MNNLEERRFVLEESIKELEKVNKKIAKLTLEKEELTKDIIAALGHQKEGQKTYEVDLWRVTVKTPYIYALDVKAYKNGDLYIDPEFDPIKQSISYSVDKKLFDAYFQSAPQKTRDTLIKLITVKPGKASVTVGIR
ncbi:MAG: hypothetical protein AB7F29_13725 [Candidatus Nitrosocosmicus sp.]